ncbi:MAG TPA: hypothetical protein VK636_08075, partial [Gemmatimonadaceae bacterium]|nr:hypothetical protein [Gemmatimonadaceae bacterium]
RIGILLGVMPRMLHDVVNEVLGAESDMHVVADSVEDHALVERSEQERPDVVILVVPSGPPPPVCGELLDRFPRLTVVALEDRGRGGSIYALRPVRVQLGEVSREQLIVGIRKAMRPRPFGEVVEVDS